MKLSPVWWYKPDNEKTSCRSGVAYRDVGEGREQDAEASRRDSRRGRRSCRERMI
jgi:hypothetical protein